VINVHKQCVKAGCTVVSIKVKSNVFTLCVEEPIELSTSYCLLGANSTACLFGVKIDGAR
jgi:hypothetical protein